MNTLDLSKPILVDMDQILVDMVPTWLDNYRDISGENIYPEDITNYNLRKLVKHPEKLDEILSRKGFFLYLSPIRNAMTYFNKLINDGFNIIIVTQAPRVNSYAIEEKREWLKFNSPNFDLRNMVFTHRKELVDGCLLFDDCPAHVTNWKAAHPNGIVCTIDYPYNLDTVCDIRFSSATSAWKGFYEFVSSHKK